MQGDNKCHVDDQREKRIFVPNLKQQTFNFEVSPQRRMQIMMNIPYFM